MKRSRSSYFSLKQKNTWMKTLILLKALFDIICFKGITCNTVYHPELHQTYWRCLGLWYRRSSVSKRVHLPFCPESSGLKFRFGRDCYVGCNELIPPVWGQLLVESWFTVKTAMVRIDFLMNIFHLRWRDIFLCWHLFRYIVFYKYQETFSCCYGLCVSKV